MSIARRSSRWFPTTVIVLAAVLIAGVATNTLTSAEHDRLMDRIGMDWPALRQIHIWGMPLATFVQSSPGVEWHMLALVGLSLVALEFVVGSWRALLTFLLSDWLTAPVTVLILWALSGLGDNQASRLLFDPDTGSSAAAHGCLAAVIMLLPGKLAAISMAILLGISIFALTFERLDAAIAHLLGIAVGSAFGRFWAHQRETHQPAYSVA